MRRTGTVLWHASFSVIAGILYFFFVLPRWFELTGETSPTLGTVLRIVTGLLIGLAALPVVFTLLRTRRPEFGTPRLALNLRTASIVLHVVAGVLIIGTAISEIWLNLDDVGQWLFGIYGAAAALALLGIFAFYLAFVAELPPPPPKPLKSPKTTGRRGRKDKGAPETNGDETNGDETDSPEKYGDPADPSEEPETEPEPEADPEGAPDAAASTAVSTDDADEQSTEAVGKDGALRNRRPSGKTRKRRRPRGVVVVDD